VVEVEVGVEVSVDVGSGVAVSVGVEVGIWVDVGSGASVAVGLEVGIGGGVGSGVNVAIDEAVVGGAVGSWDRRSSTARLAQLAAPRTLASPNPHRRKNFRRDTVCLLAC